MFFVMDVLNMYGWWSGAIGVQIIIGTSFFFLWFRKKSQKGGSKLNVTSADERIASWKPQPLVDEEVVFEEPPVMEKLSNTCNMSTTNFLSLNREEKMQDDTIAALRKYGVGACGPRGFYGTIDIHLDLEERLAKFMGVEEACVYSYGFSTVASAIPAYAKKGDLIFADECVCFAIQKGFDASRSTIHYYRHNDMSHLEELLVANAPKLTKKRSFIVTEGIFFNMGDMCDLPKLVELRKKYKLRLILDESLTIGVVGKHGRGLTEYFNIPIHEVDLVIGSLEHSFSTIGGFCVGSHYIVEHQRLSGLGYCFSASLPPLLTQAAITALDFIESDCSLIEKLNANSKKLHSVLTTIKGYRIGGDDISPMKHLYLDSEELSVTEKESYLKRIVRHCSQNGIALSTATYLRNAEVKCPEPSIKITSNSLIADGQIDKLKTLLLEARSSLDI